MTRISTLQLNSLSVGSALAVQTQFAQAETQQASGLVASDFGTLGGGATSEMLNLQDGIAQAQTWASDAQTVGSRTQGMYTSIGNIVNSVTALQTKISAATSTADNSDLYAAVRSLQDTMASQMNAQVAGNYLFAGSKTSVPPINLSQYPSSAGSDVNTPDTSYYAGDTNVLSVRISPQQSVSYGVTADNQAFEEAMRATQAVLGAYSGTATTSVAGSLTEASPTTAIASSFPFGSFTINGGTAPVAVTVGAGNSLQDIADQINSQTGTGVTATVEGSGSSYMLKITNATTAALSFVDGGAGTVGGLGLSDATFAQSQQNTLKAALGLSTTAIQDLSNLQETVGASSSQLSNAHDQQTTYVTYLQTSLSSVKDVDTAQTAAKVSQYQTQLQASYLAVAQISKVNLAQYL